MGPITIVSSGNSAGVRYSGKAVRLPKYNKGRRRFGDCTGERVLAGGRQLASFFRDLRRRKVFGVAISYCVVAWLLLQVADVVVPALLLPDSVTTFVTLLLILGFPVAVVLAWAYDLTPDGLKLTPAAEDSGEPNPADNRLGSSRLHLLPVAPPELASIAVVPFRNLTPDSEFAFLGEALAVELHSSLSRVQQLRVASLSLSFATEITHKNIREVAQELGVQFVVSGSVEHVGEKIRVIAEVDDAREGTLLWSERYETDASEILTVQKATAEAIVSAFGGERLRSEIEQAGKMLPESLDAWGLVQQSRKYVLSYSPEALAKALETLQRAIELDPNYAIAQASLGLVRAELVINGMSSNLVEDLSIATAAAQSAETLALHDSFVLRTAGCVWAYSGNYERSERLLRRAVTIAPFDLGAWGYLGWPIVSKGTSAGFSELHAILDRLLVAAPRHPGHAYWLFHKSVVLTCQDRCEEAVPYAEESGNEQPRFALGLMHKANLLGRLGDRDGARTAADQCMNICSGLTPAYYTELMSIFSDVPAVVTARTSGLRSAELLS